MFPNVFAWLKASSAVTGIIGLIPRCYKHGSAPQGVVAPYVTHFVITGNPESSISDLPPCDRFSIQIDCWSDNNGTGSLGVETLAEAVRNAIESHGHIVGMTNGRDPETQRYRIGFILDVWQNRPEDDSSSS